MNYFKDVFTYFGKNILYMLVFAVVPAVFCGLLLQPFALFEFLPAVIPKFAASGEFFEEIAHRCKWRVVALHVNGERIGSEGELLVFLAELFGEEDDEVVERKLVTTLRQDSLKGLLSKESPLGKAIMGKHVGDRICVKVNDSYSYYIVIKKITKGEDDESIPISTY